MSDQVGLRITEESPAHSAQENNYDPLGPAKRVEKRIECAMCPATKGAVNHWWCVWIDGVGRMVITSFKEDLMTGNAVHAICGTACLLKAVQKFTNRSAETIQAP